MTIAKILVPVDGSPCDEVALIGAIRTATPFCAHVSAVYAHLDPGKIAPPAVPLSAEAMTAILEGNAKVYRDSARQIREMIARISLSEDVVAEEDRSSDRVTISFLEALGYPPELLGAMASLSDLLVSAACTQPAHRFDIAAAALLKGKCPVLITPKPLKEFRKIVIGWNNSVAAAHSLSAALPFLEKASTIELVCLVHDREPQVEIGRALSYLRTKGLEFSSIHMRQILGSTQHALGDFAVERHADLLVVGGFGHSRTAETLFGGVTNDLLFHPPLPVLLVH